MNKRSSLFSSRRGCMPLTCSSVTSMRTMRRSMEMSSSFDIRPFRAVLIMVVVVSTPSVSRRLTQTLRSAYGIASLSAQVSSRAAASTGFCQRSIGVSCVGSCVHLKRCEVSCSCSLHRGQSGLGYV